MLCESKILVREFAHWPAGEYVGHYGVRWNYRTLLIEVLTIKSMFWSSWVFCDKHFGCRFRSFSLAYASRSIYSHFQVANFSLRRIVHIVFYPSKHKNHVVATSIKAIFGNVQLATCVKMTTHQRTMCAHSSITGKCLKRYVFIVFYFDKAIARVAELFNSAPLFVIKWDRIWE